MNIKKTLYVATASTALVASTLLTGAVASANSNPGQSPANQPNTQKAKTAKDNSRSMDLVSRGTGSQYNSQNSGYNTTVTSTSLLSQLSYKVQTTDNDGSISDNPFSIRIYKNGSLYKTISSSSGTLSGSLWVGSGTYTVKVYTTNGASHWTGGLTLGGLI